jgi:pimeloyl-ACP methyl ester carboxylesterase
VETLKQSSFKNPKEDHLWFATWVSQLEELNQKKYTSIKVNTSIGTTHIWALNTEIESKETLVIFPGARTSALFWDFDNALSLLEGIRIFLVETNGLPNLSDGATPDIYSYGYGIWANELFDKLGIDKAFIAGASFGGLVCMKLCLTNPSRVKASFLLNPACLQPFSLSFKNLYYNLLPICMPTSKNVASFLNQAIFSKPNHGISADAERLLIEYELFALKRYSDKTQKPYYMKEELDSVVNDIYLLLGDNDILFPSNRSVINAHRHLKYLKEYKVFKSVGHGIETYLPAIDFIQKKINYHKKNLYRV